MAPLRQKRVFNVALLLFVLLWSGCITHRDITGSSQYPSDYVVGGTYRIKQDVVAHRAENGLETGTFQRSVAYALSPDMHPRLSDVQARPKHYLREYVIVRADTLVRIERFNLTRHPEVGPYASVSGRVLGGPLARQELDLSLISKSAGPSALSVTLLMVNTNFLERAEQQ